MRYDRFHHYMGEWSGKRLGMDDDQEYYDLQALNRKARVFPGRERYRETTLPVGDHRDIMSIAYDTLLVIFQRITAHCTAGIAMTM